MAHHQQLKISGVVLSDADTYTVEATGECNTATQSATLTVNAKRKRLILRIRRFARELMRTSLRLHQALVHSAMHGRWMATQLAETARTSPFPRAC